MEINVNNYKTTLSDRDIRLLKKIKKCYEKFYGNLDPKSRSKELELRELGDYSFLGDEDLWLKLVTQFCVVGGARMIDNLKANKKWEKFKTEISLNRLLSIAKDRQKYIAQILKKYKATRFYNKQGTKIDELLNNPNVVKNGRIVLLNGLSHENDYAYIRNELIKRTRYFKLKSASDFMISVGLSHDVIALDTRVIRILKEYFGLNINADKVQGNEKIYLSIENALRDGCRKIDFSLALLDRMLFRFSGESAISFILKYL